MTMGREGGGQGASRQQLPPTRNARGPTPRARAGKAFPARTSLVVGFRRIKLHGDDRDCRYLWFSPCSGWVAYDSLRHTSLPRGVVGCCCCCSWRVSVVCCALSRLHQSYAGIILACERAGELLSSRRQRTVGVEMVLWLLSCLHRSCVQVHGRAWYAAASSTPPTFYALCKPLALRHQRSCRTRNICKQFLAQLLLRWDSEDCASGSDVGFYLSLSFLRPLPFFSSCSFTAFLYSLNDLSPPPALAFALSSSSRSAARNAAPLIYNIDREKTRPARVNCTPVLWRPASAPHCFVNADQIGT
jgi:hypothetical protein